MARNERRSRRPTGETRQLSVPATARWTRTRRRSWSTVDERWRRERRASPSARNRRWIHGRINRAAHPPLSRLPMTGPCPTRPPIRHTQKRHRDEERARGSPRTNRCARSLGRRQGLNQPVLIKVGRTGVACCQSRPSAGSAASTRGSSTVRAMAVVSSSVRVGREQLTHGARVPSPPRPGPLLSLMDNIPYPSNSAFSPDQL